MLVKFKEDLPYLKNINSQSLQESVLHLGKAYDLFFNKIGRYPRLKSKKHGHQSFSVPQHFKLAGNKAFIPKMKTGILMVQHRPLGGMPNSLTISRTPTGKYFISVRCEIEVKPLISSNSIVGVDLGVSRLATISDGSIVINPKFMKHSKECLSRAQRSFSRKRNGGKNRLKDKLRVAKIHEHIAAKRADYLHKVSRKLVNENQVICLENLNVAGMLKNHCLASVIQDAGIGELKRQIMYKSEEAGRTVVESSRWFASSKTCFDCGYINRDLKLSDRSWECSNCLTTHDRDINAAKNLKKDGIAGLCENRPRKEVKRLPRPWVRTGGLGASRPARDLTSTVAISQQAKSLKQETVGASAND